MTGLEWIALAISSIATTAAGATALYLGTYALAIGGAIYASFALAPKKPTVPKPEDGSYNLKQNVPSLSYVLGRVKKGGDYVFLEEKDGVAYHIICMAAHLIESFLQHYAHDEKLTLDGDGVVTSPSHFGSYLKISVRHGLSANVAFAETVAAFPSIFTADHRGDGLALVQMRVGTASQEKYLKVFPNQMPEYSCVIEGRRLYDPRDEAIAYTENLALFRFWHLTNPVGGKLARADMYLPEWAHAADVSDEDVTNRTGGIEKRYHGGFWFRADNDPVDVGRIMDQAGELIVYERPDGLVGVHAGEYVEPDIVLSAVDILSVQLDGNSRLENSVIAVRGRYIRTNKDYNSYDAAIYGNPYQADDNTERTRTVENEAIQSHNHVQRLQKLAYIRANAKRITVTAHYEAAENVPYRRFVRVNYPPKIDSVVVEITSTVQISLQNLTVTFSGIVLPGNPYDFNAAIEEGKPGASVDPLPPQGFPVPVDFDVVIGQEVISGGQPAAYAIASWTFVNAEFVYEFEWQPIDLSEPVRSLRSKAGDTSVRSTYLSDGKPYQFRLRTLGGATYSEWTDYVNRTATADPVAPGPPVTPTLAGGAAQVTFNWIAPNSANYFAAKLFLNSVNDPATATLVATEYGAASSPDQRIITGLTPGSRFGWVQAMNASGNASALVATAPASVIVT